MTSKYRVEYALKSHRRDQLIEWIKGLLAVPFVLHAQPTRAFYDSREGGSQAIDHYATAARGRYAQVMADVEAMISDHIECQTSDVPQRSKLRFLVPAVGNFFTPLLLQDAFLYQDSLRRISYRRLVPPSFNDIRVIMNTAQMMSLVRNGPLKLVTFDGDVTLYEDGASLEPTNPIVSRLVKLLKEGKAIGIVTAAGYTEAEKYYGRLFGLLEAVKAWQQEDSSSTAQGKPQLVVIGGESNFMFEYDAKEPSLLRPISPAEWLLPEMETWTETAMQALLDVAESALRECIANLCLEAQIVRKERAVGIIPAMVNGTAAAVTPMTPPRFEREQLEETVLVVQQVVESSAAGQRIPFCAFNGGNDVFVDIGDKSWGVRACQNYLGGIHGSRSFHVGDQFLSAGANDFKARLACTTAWIASPAETVALLDELFEHETALHAK